METKKPTASGQGPEAAFKPYVPADQAPPEFTVKAVVLGSIFGIIFGAATVYLALKAGLTVSASIPIAVLSIAVFKKIGRSTILENNIVQTIGSAGESIAAGVVFTIPALLFLSGGQQYFNYFQIMTLAGVGGILGVLFMIPLRRSLIVKEHGNLLYPEGTACADVLMAGERSGQMAKLLFHGLWAAMIYKFLYAVIGLWREQPAYTTARSATLPNATVSAEISPEFLGVGYIIGPRIAGVMVSGGVLSWIVLIPLLSMFVPEAQVKADLAKLGYSEAWANARSQALWYYNAYVRYIGAGAVAMAGLMTLVKTLPTIVASFKDSLADLSARGAGGADTRLRTERDIPITYVFFGSLALVLLIALLPSIPHGPFPGSLLMGLLVIVFGFFFVTVSSRIVGIIGSSSNPISGMTIATLMATCLIFLSVGWGGDSYQAVALCVGALVCIAAANAGATSQDLKTGYLVGATPLYQQLGLIIGVVVSVGVIGFTLMGMHMSTLGPIGENQLPAPQATLMATIVKGILSQQLPWGYIFVGAALAVVVQLCGVSPLAWAVGAYLPISTTMPIFIGGMMRALADRLRGEKEESEISPGTLFATGLVAGGALTGTIIALSTIPAGGRYVKALHWGDIFEKIGIGGTGATAGAVILFALLAALLVKTALRKSEI